MPAVGQSLTQTDSLDVYIYFKCAYSNLDLSLRNNKARLDAFVESLRSIQADSTKRLQVMNVVGSASPEGGTAYNVGLGDRRAKRLYRYLTESFPWLADSLRLVSIGVDWHGLETAVENSDVPYRDEVLDIIRTAPVEVFRNGVLTDSRRHRLMKLRGGIPWQYMRKHIFPDLRRSIFRLKYETDIECPKIEPIVPIDTIAPAKITTEQPVMPELPPIPSFAVSEEKLWKPVVALRTNLLLPLLNFGVEVPIGNRWTVGADYYYPWAFRKWNHKNCFQILFWSAEGRYWFGKNHLPGEDNWKHRLTGHSVGVYAGWGYYDFEHNYSGHQGDVYSFGADYLYAVPIARNKLRMEFSIALGGIFSDAQAYHVYEEGGLLIRRRGVIKRFRYFGPTKASVSFVIPIGKTIRRTAR